MVRVAEFTGRQWLVEQCDDFFDRNDRGYFVVEADAGLGKTTFAAWLVSERGYLGHFTRLPGGRTRTSALRNLSAQLIEEFDLFPEIEAKFVWPGLNRAVVPEWVDDPANFARLLDLAAEKATSAERLITLVVDGLDEEQPPSSPVPLGLPANLPAGVRVIATCRTGTHVRLDGTAQLVAPISRDDPRNLADMRDYLAAAAVRPALARQLDAGGMSTDAFISRLVDQCGGVWVYLSYLLLDLSSGELALTELDRLPAKLSDYFAANLERWRDDPLWTVRDLPLLGALAAVFEPVGPDLLSDVTGVDSAIAKRLCEGRYRSFLRVARENRQKRFAVYHRSLSDFVAGHGDDAGVTEATRDLTDELSEHVATAHQRIAEHYLARFGGDVGRHDGYGLRYLTAHLRKAERHGDIRRVLLPATPENPLYAWYSARRDLDTYTREVLAEIAPAREETDSAPLTAELEPLRFEVYAALFLAARAVDPDSGFAELIGPLLEFGLWTPETALRQAEGVSNPALRARSLLVVLPHITGHDRDRLLELVRAVVFDTTAHPLDRMTVAAGMHRLEPGDKPVAALLDDPAGDITDPVDAALALVAVAPHHQNPRKLYWAARDRLRQVADPIARAHGLANSVRIAPPAEIPALAGEALDLAGTQTLDLTGLEVPDIDHRAAIAVDLLDFVPAASRTPLWNEINETEFPDPYLDTRRLVALARHAPGHVQRHELIRRALLRARAVSDAHIAAQAIVMVYRSLD
jgi:hypothetical protein